MRYPFWGTSAKIKWVYWTQSHKIERFESEGDLIYRREVAYLFEHEKDPIELIRWKDVLEQLEDTLDHCEHIADMLRGVVMKYA